MLAPEVRSALSDQDTTSGGEEVLAAVQNARSVAADELRAEAARREPDGSEAAGLLTALADRLDQQRMAAGVDRLVHELVSDLLADALTATDADRGAQLTARAFALKAIARQAPLWPGAGPRLGCSYGYDSVLAVVRRSAEATGA